ncbi:MAG: hypothetical protein GX558_09865, partial [Clostridiales bacterium]|nr:hypothetical protein [Clostridiales bacterium]
MGKRTIVALSICWLVILVAFVSHSLTMSALDGGTAGTLPEALGGA